MTSVLPVTKMPLPGRRHYRWGINWCSKTVCSRYRDLYPPLQTDARQPVDITFHHQQDEVRGTELFSNHYFGDSADPMRNGLRLDRNRSGESHLGLRLSKTLTHVPADGHGTSRVRGCYMKKYASPDGLKDLLALLSRWGHFQGVEAPKWA